MSIRFRLTLWYTALLALVLAGFAIFVYVAIAAQLSNQLDYDIQLRALNTSRALRAIVPSWAGGRVRPVDLPATALTETSLYVQLVEPDGDVLVTSPNLARPLPVPATGLQLANEGKESEETVVHEGERVVVYSAPLLVDGNVSGVLLVGAPLRPLEQNLAQLRLVLGAVVLGAVVVAALLGWFLATKAIRPVDQMTRTARAIGRSADFSRRLAEPRERDELGRLATTFNEMLGQLEEAITAQRRFLADASHELRTPLTAVRTNVEALLRGADADPTERDEILRAIARETDRMGRLVADLLALARADAGQPLALQPVDLDALLLDVYQQQRRLAEGVELRIGELEQVEVNGDPDRLKQLVLNLVDNALRYTPPGGTVTLDLVSRDGLAELVVRDTGPGIAAEHLVRIFDRFYRVDSPRARQAGGTGLGLAICKWIAEAHGGRIEVESRVGGGSTFRILLPTAERTAEAPSLTPVASVPSLG